MPGLPGAQTSRANNGDRLIFQARACSRPPDPTSRMFIARLSRTEGAEVKVQALLAHGCEVARDAMHMHLTVDPVTGLHALEDGLEGAAVADQIEGPGPPCRRR